MLSRNLTALLSLVLVALLAGCASSSLEKSPADTTAAAKARTQGAGNGDSVSMDASSLPAPNAAQVPPAPPPAPKETVDEFAQRMVTTLSGGDSDTFARSIDLARLVLRGAEGLELGQETLQGFLNGFRKTFVLPQQISNGIAQKGALKLLRVRERDGASHALVRAIVGGGVNYYELRVENVGGEQRVTDIYIYMNGEYISDSVRRVLLPISLSQKKTEADELTANEIDFVKHADDITRMRGLAEQGNIEEALAIYDTLPESLRNNKNMLLLRLTYATKASREEYAKAIQALQANFPDDPNLDLPRIDGLFMNGDRAATLATIDRLNGTLGGDAYLETLAGNIHAIDNQIALAKSRYRKSIAMEPTLDLPYWQLLSLSLREKDYDTTVEILGKVETDLRFTLNDLTKVEIYNDFIASEQYRDWVATRPTGAPGAAMNSAPVPANAPASK